MFKVKDRQITSVEPFEYLPAGEGAAYALGECLTLGATAEKCAVGERPDYICMGPSDGTVVPAIPVLATTRFEAPYEAEPAIGAEVQISADGLQLTAATGGAFTVTGVDKVKGTAVGYFK